MAVKIRLKRMGKIRTPFYRVVVMDSRTKRDGRAIEEIGKYHPTEEPSLIDINSERAQYWLTQGAQPTEAVEALLKITGDWQKFKGEPGAEGTLKVKAATASKKELYEAAVAAAGKSADAGPATAVIASISWRMVHIRPGICIARCIPSFSAAISAPVIRFSTHLRGLR